MPLPCNGIISHWINTHIQTQIYLYVYIFVTTSALRPQPPTRFHFVAIESELPINAESVKHKKWNERIYSKSTEMHTHNWFCRQLVRCTHTHIHKYTMTCYKLFSTIHTHKRSFKRLLVQILHTVVLREHSKNDMDADDVQTVRRYANTYSYIVIFI